MSVDTISTDEARQLIRRGRLRSKYRAKPTTVNGRRYDSRAEARRGAQLDAELRAGLIRFVSHQPTFELGCRENVYRADFLIWNLDGTTVVEDVKGFETGKFKRDRKLWAAYGPCQLRIIKCKRDRWSVETVEGGRGRPAGGDDVE